jgi:hypothetical protein
VLSLDHPAPTWFLTSEVGWKGSRPGFAQSVHADDGCGSGQGRRPENYALCARGAADGGTEEEIAEHPGTVIQRYPYCG